MDHLDLAAIEAAAAIEINNGYIVETPVLDASSVVQDDSTKVYLKLENLQIGGCYKMRGVSYCFHQLQDQNHCISTPLVTMSAGNYGKTFAMMAKKMNAKGVVCMPETAPLDRRETIKSYGVQVDVTTSRELLNKVNEYVEKQNMTFLHSFDDLNLITGHGSLGIELLKQLGGPLGQDYIVIVPCGGGGLLAGLSATLRLAGSSAKIIGVEPEGAPGQYNSRVAGKAVSVDVKTIASGLAPPFAGEKCFALIQQHVDDLVLVTDQDIKQAMKVLYDRGLVVEPSGAASLAALLSNKVGDVRNKKVICIISGGNISPKELIELIY